MVFAEVLELASLKQSLLSGHDKLDYSQMEKQNAFSLSKMQPAWKVPTSLASGGFMYDATRKDKFV